MAVITIGHYGGQVIERNGEFYAITLNIVYRASAIAAGASLSPQAFPEILPPLSVAKNDEFSLDCW